MKPFALLLLTLSANADSSTRYSGVCHVDALISEQSSEMTVFDAPCTIEDMSDPSFNNRFRVLLKTRQRLSLPLTADYVRVQNILVNGGAMRISSLLWGNVTVIPSDPEIRRQIERQPWAYETRPQNLIVRRLNEDTIEVFIVEYPSDFIAGVGSQSWEAKHMESMRLLGRAK